MKMISSAKMHKAEMALKRLTPFRSQIESIISSLLSSDAQFSSPLLDTPDVKRVAIVVYGSDDGLCGAYNINIFKQLLVHIGTLRGQYGDNVSIELHPIGNKMAKAVRKFAENDPNVETVYTPGVDSKTTGNGVKTFIDMLTGRFTSLQVERVDLLYMNYISAARQRIDARTLLPVTFDTLPHIDGLQSGRPFLFEPDPASIFRTILPMYLTGMMQEVFTKNRASEQAARVMAMQSANDNARKLLEQLRLEYNKLRQQSITTELLDILGGQIK